MVKWRVGCSGFYYKNWKGNFYPDDLAMKNWLSFYCEHFNTLELNVSFYQFPTKDRMKKWFFKTPGDFVFTVKAPRLITHYKKFNNCKRLLEDFYMACSKGLQNKLGCVLFQLPPSFHYNQGNLHMVMNSLGKDFINVIEFRHTSWWNSSVYDALAENKIVFCSISYPGLPDDTIINSSISYVRMHGVPDLYRSKYKNKELNLVASRILKNKKVKEAYVYFNNTDGNNAVKNAQTLNKIIA